MKAESRLHRIELALTPTKPLVLHGDEGFFVKGTRHGRNHGSFYTGFSSLEGEGTIRVDGKTLKVEATAWFDHEFGSYHLPRHQRGWDWFSLQMDDGADLMLYLMKAKDGSFDRLYGAWIDPEGHCTHLGKTDISLRPTGHWTSPMTSATYDTGWSLEIEASFGSGIEKRDSGIGNHQLGNGNRLLGRSGQGDWNEERGSRFGPGFR